ncbi:unnamed protein product [Candida verbasci]|uniref:Cleavage and polyadenylation specificity factor subunit 2 n=1 Tax=Candida verbasci TaxID=1227364 RepID=A0A9W4TWX7_9ASCO|nr:unnamed protein product [Candida verbasci]
MFSFSLLTPGKDDDSFKASLLTFDNEFKILADPYWNGQDSNIVTFLEIELQKVNAILLSHSTEQFLSGFILLCIKFPNLLSNIPIYSTLPVNQLGRVSTVEYYRSHGILGPISTSFLELDEIDNWFDKVKILKYQQSQSLFDNKVTITPYNAGHSLGGTFWLINKRINRIIYAPNWNHSKDSFLNSASFISSSTGNPHLSLLRPTAFITSSDLGSTISQKKRIEKFLTLVDATLANGGCVLLPTSLSGRFLEIFHIIDERLKGAPIPVYFLSYSGTKTLSYASNLVDWMSNKFIKEWEETSTSPFNPSKVDLLLDTNQLAQLQGSKIVFCSGVDFDTGDISCKVLQNLCNDEKTTIILTEKSRVNESLSSKLYNEWYEYVSKQNGGKVENGIAIPMEKTFEVQNFTEENLTGNELIEFQNKVTTKRKEKLLAKVRDQKNLNLLNADTVDAEDSSDDDEEEDEEDEIVNGNATENNDATVAKNEFQVDELASHEAFIMDRIKTCMENHLPIDIKITHRLKPRHAIFPLLNSKAKKFDDYGEIIDIKAFEKNDEFSTTQIINEGKKKFESSKSKTQGKKGNESKLTPQEQINQQILTKYLDVLENPVKRNTTSFSLKMRCALSFIDFSGLVDLRSLGIIVQSLKPYNLIIIPDKNNIENGLVQVESFFKKQQDEAELEQSKKNLMQSTRYLSLSTIRDGLSSAFSPYSNNKMNVLVVHNIEVISIGTESEYGSIGLNNFEVNLDDEVVKSLKWQKIGSNYKIAKIYGELEVSNQDQEHKYPEKVSDVLNSQTHFSLKKVDPDSTIQKRKQFMKTLKQSKLVLSTAPKLAIGNIKLTELKKKLQAENLNAEFKGEGVLVVNDRLAIRKIAYGIVDNDDSGDVVIDGSVGPLFYKVKEMIREMLAYL